MSNNILCKQVLDRHSKDVGIQTNLRHCTNAFYQCITADGCCGWCGLIMIVDEVDFRVRSMLHLSLRFVSSSYVSSSFCFIIYSSWSMTHSMMLNLSTPSMTNWDDGNINKMTKNFLPFWAFPLANKLTSCSQLWHFPKCQYSEAMWELQLGVWITNEFKALIR
jgi:hypothetical protein